MLDMNRTGEKMILDIEKMVTGGDCIAEYEGKKVFVPYAIPGEKVRVEIVKNEKDYMRAEIKEIIEKSPHRVIPFCSLYGKCGGCNLQHIDSEHQAKLRLEILKNAFEKEGVELPEVQIVSGSDRGYRSRFQFHSGGLMGRKSNDIIPVESCPCATPEINHYLSEVPLAERSEGRVHVFGSSSISSIPEGYDKLIIAEIPEEVKMKKKKVMERTPSGAKCKKQKKIKARYEGTTCSEATTCSVDILGKKLAFDVQGFFQSNMEVLSKTIPLITEGLSGNHVLDMYSGCGTFSVFLADKFDTVTLVEHNKNAIVYAEQNLFAKKHESFGVSGEVWTKYHADTCMKKNGKFDAAVIDPPRSGMEKSVCQWLSSSGIPVIRSLSCDISTHARDAKFLCRAGYKIEKAFLLDFYPQTGHIESLLYFKK